MVTKSRSESTLYGALCIPWCITFIASTINRSNVFSVEATNLAVGAGGQPRVGVAGCAGCFCACKAITATVMSAAAETDLRFMLSSSPRLLPERATHVPEPIMGWDVEKHTDHESLRCCSRLRTNGGDENT